MITPLQVLFFIGSSLAPAGTHQINITSGAETYLWEPADDGKGWKADSCQLKPYGAPEDTAEINNIKPVDSKEGWGFLKQVRKHDWAADPIIRFDDAHQLEKSRDGYVYVVRPGDPTQKTYSITFVKADGWDCYRDLFY